MKITSMQFDNYFKHFDAQYSIENQIWCFNSTGAWSRPRVLNPWFSALSYTTNFRILERDPNLALYLFRLYCVIVLHEPCKMPGPFMRAKLIVCFDGFLMHGSPFHIIWYHPLATDDATGMGSDSVREHWPK